MNSKGETGEAVWAVGFMTGTSVDAVDAAMILTDGSDIMEFGPVAEVPYSDNDRAVIHSAVQAAREWNWSGTPPEEAFAPACAIAVAGHTAALEKLLSGWSGPKPVIAGVHGQTVLHRRATKTQKGATLQIIDAAAMRDALGLPLAYDFRSADVEAGGQGAPLAPAYHQALLKTSGLARTAVQNLGGVANITVIEGDGRLVAFDCGPANGPIDEWILRHGRGKQDVDGAFAAAGEVDEARLSAILQKPFFDAPPPKSLDRYDFDADLVDSLSLEDGAATLTELCARAIALGCGAIREPIDRLVLCGGGRHNPTLVSAIRNACSCEVMLAEDVGWRGDSIEAEAFALLAVRTLRGLPISFPGTTGAPQAMTGGRIFD